MVNEPAVGLEGLNIFGRQRTLVLSDSDAPDIYIAVLRPVNADALGEHLIVLLHAPAIASTVVGLIEDRGHCLVTEDRHHLRWQVVSDTPSGGGGGGAAGFKPLQYDVALPLSFAGAGNAEQAAARGQKGRGLTGGGVWGRAAGS